MYKHEMISSLKNHYDKNPKLVYYKKCLDDVNSLESSNFVKDSFGELLVDIPKQATILESVRITINYNIIDYYIYLYHKRKKNCTNYLIKLNDADKNKFLHQLVCVTEFNDVLSLAKDIIYPDISFVKDGEQNYHLYFIITKNPQKFKKKYYELKNLYEITGYVYGIDIFNLIKYQRIDRIVNFINKSGEGFNKYKNLNNFLGALKFQKWYQRDRILVMSGVIFQTLGTTYTDDIDILIIAEKVHVKKIQGMLKRFNDFNLSLDVSILASDGNWYSPKGMFRYRSIWLTYVLPSLTGAHDIFEIMSNPTFFYYFMGIKCSCLEMNIVKILQRANVSSLTDLIMLNKINNYDLGPRLCIPNMTVRQGKIMVFNNFRIKKLYEDIKQKLKLYYNYDMSLPEIKEFVTRCHTKVYNIYEGYIIRDPDTWIIKAFHRDVENKIYEKYISGANNLLDIGTGKLNDLRFWNYYKLKNVVGVEPSVESIKKAYEKLEKFKINEKLNITIINGFGNVPWENNSTYKKVYDYVYDVITFQHTIHYMIKDIQIVINNLKPVMKNGTKIIISCMDGNKIKEMIEKNGKVEIRNNQEPIFSIVPFEPDTEEYLVYFKGAYGVTSGSIEFIVDVNNLIEIFKQNNINLLERKNFLEYDSNLKKKMMPIQKMVSSYYISLVFIYNV
ncbi:MAG: mRNA capping enzyme [Satyrvirus sp.]|uniref:mRNA capping enzyme n=1 Tax=Satyrvirus sp. TaxID=2487771 RepID=A0A3G5AFY6_9VIRU|nr:MAG: mRNA capping enzyme [Satyrvirus sp.]